MIVNCKNLDKIDENPYVTKEGYIKIGEQSVFVEQLPQIYKTPALINRYINFGNLLYITNSNDNDIEKIFVIEQELKNGKVNIKDIYSTIKVGDRNELHSFFNYNREYIRSVLETDIYNCLLALDYAINLENLQEQINQVLDRKEVSIPELAIPERKAKLLDTKSISELAKEAGVSYGTMWNRIKVHNLSPEEATKKHVKSKVPKKVVEYDGKSYASLKDFCEAYKINYKTAWRKMNFSGYTPDEVINGKKRGKKDAKSE